MSHTDDPYLYRYLFDIIICLEMAAQTEAQKADILFEKTTWLKTQCHKGCHNSTVTHSFFMGYLALNGIQTGFQWEYQHACQ